MPDRLVLDENRFFDPDPTIREIAATLYEGTRDLPLVCPHGHVDPRLFAVDEAFPNPTELILIPDHYIFRMLYSQGIPLETLGIPTGDGAEVETDPRKIWRLFAEHYHLFAGTPTGAWLDHEFAQVFDVERRLSGRTAQEVYDRILEKLSLPEFRPRALFERFNIEVLTTTDGAADSLEHHQAIRDSGWRGRIIPCFRPDAVTDIVKPDWAEQIRGLSEAAGMEITGYLKFIDALEARRVFFKSMGCVSTDQGVLSPYTRSLSLNDAEAIFQRALKGEASADDGVLFTAHMIMEMARMSIDDGLVMQLHPGSFRNHNQAVFRRFGPDKGCDIPVRTEYTCNLHELLNRYGNHPSLTLILFTLDESAYSRELAPLAGHYPAVKLGPAWWFHDSIQGMTRYRYLTTETAGIYNTVGFNDDTRAFPSIPARHDLSRRVDANFLADLVARHIVDLSEAGRMARAMARDLVLDAYRLAD